MKINYGCKLKVLFLLNATTETKHLVLIFFVFSFEELTAAVNCFFSLLGQLQIFFCEIKCDFHTTKEQNVRGTLKQDT